MLEHRHTPAGVEPPAKIELGDVPTQKLTSFGEPGHSDTASRLGHHGRGDVDGGDQPSLCGEAPAPATDAAADVEDGSPRRERQMVPECQVLAKVDRAVVVLRHPVRAHCCPPLALPSKPPGPVLPVVSARPPRSRSNPNTFIDVQVASL